MMLISASMIIDRKDRTHIILFEYIMLASDWNINIIENISYIIK